MYDSLSFLVPGLIIIGAILLVSIIIFFILKRFIGKYLALTIGLVVPGYLLDTLNPWNYLFYITAAVFLILFIVSLFRKKKI